MAGGRGPGRDRHDGRMTFPAEEVRAAVDEYVAARERIERGEGDWPELARFFTDDAVYIDPAWGRVQGIENLRVFFDESMRGLEDWNFPIDVVAIDGDNVIVKWRQLLPGTRPDGTRYEQSGVSTLRYAGDGKFDYDEDLLNMTHVLEDLAASGWRPGEGFVMPPSDPDRNFARP